MDVYCLDWNRMKLRAPWVLAAAPGSSFLALLLGGPALVQDLDFSLRLRLWSQ